MYTECPKCQSVFMVSEQDISAHEGLVRCGNCYSVFNAAANLTDDPQGNEDADLPTSQPGASAAAGLPEGSSPVSTASDFTFNFVEEETEEAIEADAEEPAQSDSDATPEDEEIDPFPEPDFTGESLDKPAADTTSEAQEDNSLLYFGPDQAEDPSPEPAEIAPEPDPIDNTLLLGGVFNPAKNNEFDPSAEEHSAMAIETRADAAVESAEDAVDEEPYAGPEISEQAGESDGDFAMPDFSPLEGLEPTAIDTSPVAAFSTDDDQQGDVAAVAHIETNLDEASLWPDEVEMDLDDSASLPDPSSTSRFLADETHDALQAYDDGIADMGLETPGQASDDELPSMESDQPEAVADDTSPLADVAAETDEPAAHDTLQHEADPESEPEPEPEPEPKPEPDFDDFDRSGADETESVFITSEEDEANEGYQAMNVENDKAYHDSGDGDFPLPGEMEDLDQYDNPDIDKLLQQAADGQAEIDAKLAETAVEDPEMGSPDIDDDSEDGPSLIPAPPTADNGPTESPGLMNKVTAGVGAMADKLHFGRRSYHGLDTYETQEHEDTLLVRQLEHESHGSLFDFIPPAMQRVVLVLINVALIALLLFQIGKYFMDDLAQIRVLRPVLVAGCQLAGCSVPMASNPAAIEQLSSKMTILDGEKDGLRIAVTLINRDNTEQPFPALELSLTDRSGRIISRQIVKADQYRGKSAAYALMQPGQAEDVNILLRTPAVRVDGFELRPVKLNWLDPR